MSSTPMMASERDRRLRMRDVEGGILSWAPEGSGQFIYCDPCAIWRLLERAVDVCIGKIGTAEKFARDMTGGFQPEPRPKRSSPASLAAINLPTFPAYAATPACHPPTAAPTHVGTSATQSSDEWRAGACSCPQRQSGRGRTAALSTVGLDRAGRARASICGGRKSICRVQTSYLKIVSRCGVRSGPNLTISRRPRRS